jgi:CheY-like chemotaxis protein
MRSTDRDGAPHAGASDLQHLRVLVVEDDWTLATALTRLLGIIGINVVGSAATIAKAEGLLVEHGPDVALVDINLGGEMTYGLIDRLRDSGVGVVVVTGYADVHTEAAAAVLNKPVEKEELIAALRRAMAQKRAR